MRSYLVGIVVVAATATAAADTPSLDPLVGKLSKLSCPRVSDLEPVFGPQHYQPKPDEAANLGLLALTVADAGALGIQRASAELAFDIYHQQPSKVTNPGVGELAIVFDPAAKVDVALGKLAGATHYAVGKDTVWHAGSLYWSASSHQLSVMCGSVPPGWARKAWTAADVTAATKHVLDGLANTVNAQPVHDDLYDLTFTNFHPSVVFKTAMPGRELLAALGLKHVILRANDVHMTDWTLHIANGSKFGAPIEYKGWTLDIHIDESGIDKLKGAELDAATLKVTSAYASRRD